VSPVSIGARVPPTGAEVASTGASVASTGASVASTGAAVLVGTGNSVFGGKSVKLMVGKAVVGMMVSMVTVLGP